MSLKKKLRLGLLAVVAAFLLLQLANPRLTNPPVKQDLIAATKPPPAIAASLVAACYDCHSHQTIWPWYSHVVPMSLLVANDVQEGRANLDLSEWPDDPKRAARRLEDMSEEISGHEMPPKKYTAIHANARLTDVQQQALTDWLDDEADQLKKSAAH